MNIKRIYIQDLNTNDVFYFPGRRANMQVCERRRTEGSRTTVVYRPWGDARPGSRTEYTSVNLSTVDLLTTGN